MHITQLVLSKQEIHVLVKVTSSNFEFICTGIYASPRFHKRCILWNNLKNVANLHNKPWAIAEDFNEVLVEEDKYRGRMISTNRSLLFKECLDTCNMVDLGFNGLDSLGRIGEIFLILFRKELTGFSPTPVGAPIFPMPK